MTIEVEWRDYDVIVVGSGGAGSMAARAAADDGARVLVVSKDPVGCSDTKISEGNATVRAVATDDDTEETLSENIRMAGGNLPVQSITDAFAKDSQSAFDLFRAQGLRPAIDHDRDGPKATPMAFGGHNHRRSVGLPNHGIAFAHAGWNAVVQGNGVDYLEDAWFLDLVTDEGDDAESRVVGGLIYHASAGTLIAVRAPAVVIAAGGLSTLFFPKTDTMRGNTGDSYAIAARAGADLVDMEQCQFLPFCIASPPSYEGLLVGEPASASYLGVLRDKNGKVILDSVYQRTRAECSAAIMRAVADGRGSPNGGAYLDMTGNKVLPRSGPYFMRYLETCLPAAYRNARQAFSKPVAKCEEPWEVRPSAHYHMGGLRADADGAAVKGQGDGERALGIKGLFAAGQAMGGLFGANRLGSTSLTEVSVFGARAGRAATALAKASTAKADDDAFTPLIEATTARFGQVGTVAAATLKLELQQQAWDAIGPARTADGIAGIAGLFASLTERLDSVAIPGYATWNQSFIEFEELRNLLEAGKAVAAAAGERDGSLGGHVRLDRGEISVFSTPYSTVVHRDENGGYVARRETRPRTPFKKLVSYKVKEDWRRLQSKWFRYLPASVKDRKLEARYQAIMGTPDGAAPEIEPGSDDAAIAEKKAA
ncbi:MAG: FAD-binding protein [Alphaproteobacteria bacterium]|nr:FAD-binding protein [Alphaproteobacteria bacterium]